MSPEIVNRKQHLKALLIRAVVRLLLGVVGGFVGLVILLSVTAKMAAQFILGNLHATSTGPGSAALQ